MKLKNEFPDTIYGLGEYVLSLLSDSTIALEDIGHALEHKAAKIVEAQANKKAEAVKLTREQWEDSNLQTVASSFGLTMNQANGLMEVANRLSSELDGSGLCVVPFWFSNQYSEMKNQLDAYQNNTESLIEAVELLKSNNNKSNMVNLSDLIELRGNIITGVQEPYIPGVTGPLPGDEHLDIEHTYMPKKLN